MDDVRSLQMPFGEVEEAVPVVEFNRVAAFADVMGKVAMSRQRIL